MDDNTLKALTALSEKLGTTSEYLWGVLLRQAHISATIDLFVMAIWIGLAVLFLRTVQEKTKVPQETETRPHPRAEWSGDDAFFAWAGAIVFAAIVALCVGVSITDTIAGFVNPEYWALHQILK